MKSCYNSINLRLSSFSNEMFSESQDHVIQDYKEYKNLFEYSAGAVKSQIKFDVVLEADVAKTETSYREGTHQI